MHLTRTRSVGASAPLTRGVRGRHCERGAVGYGPREAQGVGRAPRPLGPLLGATLALAAIAASAIGASAMGMGGVALGASGGSQFGVAYANLTSRRQLAQQDQQDERVTQSAQSTQSTQAGASTAHGGYPYGHDNTTNPAHLLSWTHADPNTADPPGNNRLGDNYYYLKAFAAGPEVVCTVFSGGNWEIVLEDAHKHVLAHAWPLTTGGRVYITNAKVGNLYMCRISDLGTTPERDYAQLDSGAIGDTKTLGCGGPGPVWDPNFNEPPMDPAPTPGMPPIGCATPTTVPYTPGDPRLAPPHEQTAALGPIHNGAAYRFTVSRACDLTAGAFFGHQGAYATLSITNLAGKLVNGPKWGARTPSLMRMNREFVGANAGVLAPGTYVVHYSGPANNKDIYAICTPASV